jgi:heat shock protein HtpX
MTSLNLRMSVLLVVLFGILYAIAAVLMNFLGVTNISAYTLVALAMMCLQYFIGPKIVEWTMRVRYIKAEEYPWLLAMVQDLSRRAKIPMPKIGIAQIGVPNAFAFGRGIKDGRVCVTAGIMQLLDKEELKAVLAHEISHLKNRDVLFITLLSVIPMILYRIFIQLTFYSGGRRRDSGGAQTVLIGLAALIFYFITNLLVLYASRIREYFADKGAIQLGSSPAVMASALYKLVYGAARTPKEYLQPMEGVKAFFLNDLSRARREISELAQLDLDKSGTIDPDELRRLRSGVIRLSFSDKAMELFSTHPNMLKRIKHLSQLGINN